MPKDKLLSLLGAAGCTREDLLAFYRENNLFLDIPVAGLRSNFRRRCIHNVHNLRPFASLTAIPLPNRIEVSQ
jgi:hypothetical protein